MTPIGGTDSHSHFLRPSMYVLADERSPEAVRAAIVSGRTCVRAPQPCRFEVRVDGGPWGVVGSSLHGRRVEARLVGGGALVIDGRDAGHLSHVARPVSLEAGCHVLRAEAAGGSSGHTYVGCDWADPAE